MSSKIKNDLGTITVSGEVIARIAGFAAISCYGIVGMAARDVRDGLVHLLKKESLTKGVKITRIADDTISMDFHIIVEYGTNIPAICEVLLSNVRYSVEEYIGIKADKINIFVEGVRID